MAARKPRTTRARPARKPAVPALRKLQATARATASKALTAGTQAAETVRATAQDMVDLAMKRGRLLEARARQARKAVTAGAEQARNRTAEAVSQLERVFEQRVNRVITKLGVPSARDVRALTRQVAELQASVDQLRRSRARARAHA